MSSSMMPKPPIPKSGSQKQKESPFWVPESQETEAKESPFWTPDSTQENGTSGSKWSKKHDELHINSNHLHIEKKKVFLYSPKSQSDSSDTDSSAFSSSFHSYEETQSSYRPNESIDSSFSSVNSSAGRSSSQKKGKGLHPYKGMVFLAAMLVVCLTGSILTRDHSSYTEAPERYLDAGVYELTGESTLEEAGLEIQDPLWYPAGKGSVITFPLNKKDPNTALESISGDVTISYKSKISSYLDDEDAETISKEETSYWFYVPYMDFFSDEVWVSVYEPTIAPEEIVDVSFGPSLSAVKSDVERYSYLLDVNNVDRLSTDKQRSLLNRTGTFARYTIDIVDDGVEEQEGIVLAKVHKPNPMNLIDGEYLGNTVSGSYNILFKKDGKVVFADTQSYNADSSETGTFTLAYTAPHEIPEYDSVEIIDLR